MYRSSSGSGSSRRLTQAPALRVKFERSPSPPATTTATTTNTTASAKTTTTISNKNATTTTTTSTTNIIASTRTKTTSAISNKYATKYATTTISSNNNNNNTANATAISALTTSSPTATTNTAATTTTNDETILSSSSQQPIMESTAVSLGRYINWNTSHGMLATQSWCCIGDLMSFCDKYEFKSLSLTDSKTHLSICSEVKALLSGPAPFDLRKRFPGPISNPENLWVSIGLCPGIDYHLQRILNVFRKPLEKLSTDKQRIARHNFHLAINELRLDISARITEIRLYDRSIFEREFRLNWEDLVEQ